MSNVSTVYKADPKVEAESVTFAIRDLINHSKSDSFKLAATSFVKKLEKGIKDSDSEVMELVKDLKAYNYIRETPLTRLSSTSIQEARRIVSISKASRY